MKKFLILAFAIFAACLVHAQVPELITVPPGQYKKTQATPDVPCTNFAGTFTVGATGTNTQSNDVTLDTIWLCRNDSIFIDHNGDAILTGDPDPSTTPGVGYAFYSCPPTATGPALQNIIGQAQIVDPMTGAIIQPQINPDPCLLNNPPPTNSAPIYVTSGNPNGDTWFFNSGSLQTTFNMGMPLLVHFAPITFDNSTNNGYETIDPANIPYGPCVNANTAAQFEVVYLNAVEATGLVTPYNGNNCLGRFKLGGGYPEWDANALYTVDIFLQTDPTVKALINSPASSLKNNFNVIFSVPQAGDYVIVIEDGKSCGFRDTISMGACTNAENVGFVFPNVTGGPGETVCVPITTTNFTGIQGFSTSIQWDPTVLQLLPTDFIQNVNGDLVDFDPVGNTETSLIAQGYLGIANIGSVGATLSTTEVLMEVCFQILAQTDGICSPLTFTNQPSAISASNTAGNDLAVEAIPGTLCVEYNPLVIDIDTLPPPCGALNMDYTITITGEEPPYEVLYQIIPGGAVGSLNGVSAGTPAPLNDLTPGNYRIIVTPQNGADIANADTIFLDVVLPESVGASLNLNNLPSCNGSTDGEVSVTVLLGSVAVSDLSDFNFQWATSVAGQSLAQGQPTQSNVSAGTYSVTVTQVSTGCTAVASGTLGNPPALSKRPTIITPATCSGVADGCFVYEMQGGTPFPGGLYQYEILFGTDENCTTFVNAGNGTNNPYSSQCNLLPGCYQVQVTDANGCTFTDQIEVPALRTIELSQDLAATQLPSCFGGCDGELGVTVTVTPPQAGAMFFFNWTPGGTVTNQPTSSIVSDICAGSQFVIAIDASGCNDTLTVTLNNPVPFTVNPIIVNNPTCIAPQSGSISALGFGGQGAPANFTYTWSTGTSGSSISGLGEGTYTVTATDAAGCTAVFDTTLMLPLPPPIDDIVETVVKCGSDGALTAVAPTATSFMWTSPTGNTINNPNQASISGLSGGTYVVVVMDANSCVNTDTVTLAPVAPLMISNATVADPKCAGYSDGSIVLGVQGGTPNYNFAWSSPITSITGTVLGLEAGVYTVTVRDINNCTVTQTYTLTDPPAINVIVNLATPNQVSCFGECDGQATLLVNFALNNNFNFNWSDTSTDSVRVDLCAGSSFVTITETGPNQCFVVQEVIIGTPTQVGVNPAEIIIDSVSCYGLNDGRISIAGDGGNGGPYTFIWGGGQTTATVNSLPAGTYPVTITDQNGCTGTYSGVIAEPDPIVVAIDNGATQLLACSGDDNGILGVIATGGNVAAPGAVQYTYVWSDGSNQIGTTNPLDMLSAGTYSVTVTDSKGCTGTTFLNLVDPPRVIGDYELGEPIQCFGGETSIDVTNIAGGSGEPYSFTIDFGLPTPYPSQNNVITGGEHYITYIDSKNCEFTDTINVPQPPQIVVTFDPASIEIQLGESLELTPQITGLNSLDSIASFQWMPSNFLLDSTKLDSAILYTFESGTLMLTITDVNGCMGKGSLEVEVDLNRNIYVPNAFIPNDPENGLNRLFAPGGGIGVEKVNYMQVYDRWGELMYEQEDFTPEAQGIFTTGWDGRYRGKFVEPGVYVYAIEVLFVDGKKILYRGDVTVVR